MNARLDSPLPEIRPLGQGDVDDLIDIETAAYPFPWTRGIFADCLRVGYSCTGLQLGKELAGYIILNWGAGECHLLNLCVHPRWQSRGYGSLLLEHGQALATLAGCKVMFLEVRASNLRAVGLYRRHGYREIGCRRDYYRAEQGREDAIVMERLLVAT